MTWVAAPSPAPQSSFNAASAAISGRVPQTDPSACGMIAARKTWAVPACTFRLKGSLTARPSFVVAETSTVASACVMPGTVQSKAA